MSGGAEEAMGATAHINVHLRSEESGRRLAVIEEVVPLGFGGSPLHVHRSFDEGFYVLEGELTPQLRDELVTARAGTLAFEPRGVPHAFANLSGRDARVLMLCTPAGFESYFDRPLPETRVVGPPIPSSSRREG